MALADVLRQRVSRRGRTAQVDCGELGTVTVEALPPRECAALGMSDGGRALLYAACRELQTAGEALRRERQLFTPDEVTQYVSDKEARTAARTVLALSGVTLDEDEADNGDETADQGGKADNEAEKPESPDKSDETEHPDRTDEKTEENRLETVHKNVQQLPEARHEIRPGNVQLPEDAPADGQVSREFFGDDEADRTTSNKRADSDFEPQNLALSEENGEFALPLELSGDNGETAEQMVKVHEITSELPSESMRPLHETESEVQEAVHEVTSEIEERATYPMHEITSDFPVALHETTSEFGERLPKTVHESKLEFATDGRQILHEANSEVREPLHETESDFQNTPHETKSEFDENRREALQETTSELAEQVAQRLLEGLRRAAAVR